MDLSKALPKNRCCKVCKHEKPIESFRERLYKGLRYRKRTCRDCEAEQRKEVYWANPEISREKARINGKAFRENNAVRYNEKVKAYRDKNRDKVRKWEKDWYARNPEGRAKHKVRAKKFYDKAKEQLLDTYVVPKIIQRTSLKRKDIPTELIEVHRLNMRLKREIYAQASKDIKGKT